MKQVNMKKAALWYARHGWYVVPLHEPLFENGRLVGCSCEEWKRANVDPDYVCRSAGKHPRMNDWENLSTVDLRQVEKWWSAWPNANIGIAAGKSGLIVLDSDLYKTAAPLPNNQAETVTNLSGGGGEHLVYAHPVDTEKLGNSKTGLPDYIDVRGWGGQFVAPPSLHPSGNRYEWEAGYGPHEISPAALPDDIKRVLVEASERSHVVAVELGELEPVDVNDVETTNLVKALLSGDRSRIDECVITSLVRAGLTDGQIAYLFTQNAPTDKFSEKNGHGRQYLSMSIGKARAWLAQQEAKQQQPAPATSYTTAVSTYRQKRGSYVN